MNGSHVAVAGNGTLRSWIPPGCGESILYPERTILIGEERKVRGGAFVCCPIFGPVPQEDGYSGIVLPNHGLVRQHPFKERACRFQKGEARSEMWFNEPWNHTVRASTRISRDGERLTHTIRVTNNERCPMPISLGFHPYFKTGGGRFEIRHGDQRVKSRDVAHDTPLFIPLNRRKVVTLSANGRLIALTMKSYTHICVWTDNIGEYVCVEPIMRAVQGGHVKLKGRKSLSVSCEIHTTPLRR
jgi:galactose mutarotase-like enzyme